MQGIKRYIIATMEVGDQQHEMVWRAQRDGVYVRWELLDGPAKLCVCVPLVGDEILESKDPRDLYERTAIAVANLEHVARRTAMDAIGDQEPLDELFAEVDGVQSMYTRTRPAGSLYEQYSSIAWHLSALADALDEDMGRRCPLDIDDTEGWTSLRFAGEAVDEGWRHDDDGWDIVLLSSLGDDGEPDVYSTELISPFCVDLGDARALASRLSHLIPGLLSNLGLERKLDGDVVAKGVR